MISISARLGLYGSLAIAAVPLAIAVLVGLLSLLPPDSPLHVPGYVVTLLGKYLAYALLALSVDLVWG